METEPKIIRSYIVSGRAKLVYRHLLQLGPGSLRTAEASECAADQGAFWPMHDALYARQAQVNASSNLDQTLAGFARDLHLDVATFSACLAGHTHVAAIQADYRAGERAGVRFRPTFDVNGRRLTGALPFATFQQAIAEAARS